MPEPVDLLVRLIPLKCVNDPNAGLRPDPNCVSGVEDVMRASGMDPRVIESNGFYTLYDIYGSGEPVVLYLAHYDVVPPGPSWSSDPFSPVVRGGRLYGRGSADDLGNVAIISSAYREMARVADKNGGSLVVAFTGDEEIGGLNGARVLRDYLRSRGLYPRYMVNADGSGMVVINRRRNAFKITIEAEARKAVARGSVKRISSSLRSRSYHAAYFIPGSDVHPLIEIARIIYEEDLSVISLGGDFVKSNILPQRVWADVLEPVGGGDVEIDTGLTEALKAIIPITRLSVEQDFPSIYGVTATPNIYYSTGSKHVLEIDLRAPLRDKEKLEKALRSIVEDLQVNISIRVSGGGGYLDTPRSSRIVSKALKTLERIGLKGLTVERAGASDSRYFSPEGVEAIDFGPVGGNIHGPDEYVEIWSLGKAREFYIEILGELLRGDE